MIVYFLDDMIKLSLIDLNSGLKEGHLELARVDRARLVLVDPLKHGPEVLNVLRVGRHLHQNVKSNFLQG
jgi:hypothetical protein